MKRQILIISTQLPVSSVQHIHADTTEFQLTTSAEEAINLMQHYEFELVFMDDDQPRADVNKIGALLSVLQKDARLIEAHGDETMVAQRVEEELDLLQLERWRAYLITDAGTGALLPFSSN